MNRFTKAAVMTGVSGALSLGLIHELDTDYSRNKTECYENFDGTKQAECLDDVKENIISWGLSIVALTGVGVAVLGGYEMIRYRDEETQQVIDPLNENTGNYTIVE